MHGGIYRDVLLWLGGYIVTAAGAFMELGFGSDWLSAGDPCSANGPE